MPVGEPAESTPQQDRATSGHVGADRDPAGPGPPARCDPPGQDPVIAENPAGGGGRRRALEQDGGNLMPRARGTQLGAPVLARPADCRRRQEGCADQEHRQQQGQEAGRDLVGAPPQRVAIQAQLARDPRCLPTSWWPPEPVTPGR
jgi:hypothetical protein